MKRQAYNVTAEAARPERIGGRITALGEVDSTNSYALGLGDGAAHGDVVTTDKQLKGRGRLGRGWIAAPGLDVVMSVVLRPMLPAGRASLLTLLPAVACCDALREAAQLPVGIKWPNDLIIGGKKLGGILTETRIAAESIVVAVIGIGINLNSLPEGLPADVRERATSVRCETGKEHDRGAVCAAICRELNRRYDAFMAEGETPLLDAWRRRAAMLGLDVGVSGPAGRFYGTARDIDEHGRLVLDLPSGETMKINAGDVTVLKEPL